MSDYYRHNPTARVSTFAGRNLTLADYGWGRDRDSGEPVYKAGSDASKIGARIRRDRGRIRGVRSAQYVGCAGRAGVPRPGDEKFEATIDPNADKPRGAFATIVDGVRDGRISVDQLEGRTRRRVERILGL